MALFYFDHHVWNLAFQRFQTTVQHGFFMTFDIDLHKTNVGQLEAV